MPTPASEPEPERWQTAFATAVKQEFAYLVEVFGFQLVHQEDRIIRSESRRILLTISIDPAAAYELAVDFSERLPRRGRLQRRYGYLDVLDSIGVIEATGIGREVHWATSPELVRTYVAMLARLVLDYARPALRGEERFFDQLERTSAARSHAYMVKMGVDRAKRYVEPAWAAKDYVRVVAQYGPVESDLERFEQEQLDYAREQILSGREAGQAPTGLLLQDLVRTSWRCVHFQPDQDVEQLAAQLRAGEIRLFQVDAAVIRSEGALFAAISQALALPAVAASWDELREGLWKIPHRYVVRGNVLVLRGAAALWRDLPLPAASLTEVWLAVAERRGRNSEPFHLVYLW